MIKKILFLTIFSMLGFVTDSTVSAAEPWGEVESERDAREEMDADARSAQKEMGSSVYGRVTSVEPASKTLSLVVTDDEETFAEEDADQDAPEEYRFQSESTLTGIDSFDEISVGDYITIDYYTYNDANVIDQIVFDKHGDGETVAAESGVTKTTKPFGEKDLMAGPEDTFENLTDNSRDLVG